MWSASLASPTAWPTMPSADFCVPIRSPRGSLSPKLRDGTQTSRGKSDRLHHTPAGSTALALDGCGLRDQLSARPTKNASYPVSVRQVTVLIHASFRPRLATTPLRFTSTSSPSDCAEDSHLLAVKHARHTTKPLLRRTLRVILFGRATAMPSINIRAATTPLISRSVARSS